MLVVNHNNKKTELKLDEFYSHELRIQKLKGIGAGFLTLHYKHSENTAENNQTLLAILLILQNLQSKRDILTLNVTFDYMPFSRMDKEDALYEETLRPFLTLIKPLIDNFLTTEIHSETMFERILGEKYNNNRGQSYFGAMSYVDRNVNSCLVAVDQGVVNRYPTLFSIQIKKRRNDNGEIVKQYIDPSQARAIESYKEFVFVDDICSKGTTFINAANLIKQYNPDAKFHLYVEFLEKAAHDAGLQKPLYEIFQTVSYQKFI